jgi:hypothetical protein
MHQSPRSPVLPIFCALLLTALGLAPGCQTPTDEDAQGTAATESVSADLSVSKRPCISSAQCPATQYCTTEDGVCNRPPGCRPGQVCQAICYGLCEPRQKPVPCGPSTCAPGQVCCNESCGICTPPGGVCTEQICEPQPGRCRSDADCRTFSDYCTGCDCRALSVGQKDPVCPGPGVQCFVDPCLNQQAHCTGGICQLGAQ